VIDASSSFLRFDLLCYHINVLKDLDWVSAEAFDINKPLPKKLENALLDTKFALTKLSE
jgi:hypothetical protein